MADDRTTEDFPGGWTWVGERGPEQLNLPAGTVIYPALSTDDPPDEKDQPCL